MELKPIPSRVGTLVEHSTRLEADVSEANSMKSNEQPAQLP